MKKGYRSAFTMIELIFVIIILGILAVTALPKFVGVQDDAKIRQTDEDVIIGDNTKITSELGWVPKKALKNTIKEMYEEKVAYYENML